jgi:Na+-transporting NADH:ubiquinone oxidoreductase subunit A
MSKTVKIRKGANINLFGIAECKTVQADLPKTFAIKPTEFHGIVPKMMLKEGAEVKVGTPIFHDKKNEHIKYVSPTAGVITEIVRGAKRKILEIRIQTASNQESEIIAKVDVNSIDRAKALEFLMNAGLWCFIKKRPYDIVADPMEIPKAIFISGFDSAPLGVSYDYLLEGQEQNVQTGIDLVAKLTKGKVHFNINAGDSSFLSKLKNVEINRFDGPHPAGNVGIQIHHLDPINKGEVVWVINPQSVAIIGRLVNTGVSDFSKKIALVGSEVKEPCYINTWAGAAVSSIINGRVKDGDNRIIDGNVLSGTQVSSENYIGYTSTSVSVIPEGREPQFMGWIAPNFHKFSLSHSYFSWLMPGKKYSLNTNANGEDRAFVMSGQYEDLLPMDVYPVHLIKSIITNDIEKMETLGIYEVAPEDFALCEFACTSKTQVQEIIRKGLDTAIEELG